MSFLGCLHRCLRIGHFLSSLSTLILVVAFTACAPLPAPTPPAIANGPAVEAPAAISGTSVEIVPALIATALIASEREASIAGDTHLLTDLWASDARIIDGRGTDDPADDYVWQGRGAILDRYAIAVFPAPPPPLDPSLLDSIDIIVDADGSVHAELGVDRWKFVQQDDGWRLLELRYN